MTGELPTLPALKDQAKRLRAALETSGTRIGHSAALELVARQHGFRDWNCIAAKARETVPAVPFAVGRRVAGRYLGQAFRGSVHAMQTLAEGRLFRLTIVFDEPVDVVTFDSFSALRRRITTVVDRSGVSPRKRSGGEPHLILED